MRARWTVPTIVSLSLSTASLVAVVVFALVSCTTQSPETSSQPPAQTMPGEALGGLRDLQSSFHAISEAVSPSVVRIDVSEQIAQGDSRERQPFFDFFFGNPDDNEPRAPGFERGSVGSGVIVSSDRRRFYILTNDHVVGAADRIAVILEDGTELEAELVGRDPRKDLAMVVVRTNLDLPVARLGDSDTLRVGDWVVAIGSPFGYQNTVTVGIVSALGRRGGPADNISDFIQTDASINQGNSGGALLNLDGEVVGINTWITSDTGGSIGLGFAIPINNARRSIEEFLRDGEVEYGWLGVSIQSVDIAQVEELGLPSRFGALVDGVFADSPASRNGLVAGDFIYRIDGKSIRNSDDLVLVVGELAVGTKTTLEIVRNRESLSLTLSLDERKSNATISQSYRQLWPGFSVYPLSREMMEEASIDVRSGVVVAVVDPGTAAHISGLRTFDVITRINDNSVTDLASFYTIVANSDQREWQLSGIRDGEKFQVTVVR